MRKYSTLRASAKELGGTIHSSVVTFTNESSAKPLGSTMELKTLVNTLNSFVTRKS